MIQRELEDEKRKLNLYLEHIASLQAQIEQVKNPSPAELAERADRQNHLAKLVDERLKKDELIQAALQGLRQLLEERASLSAKIAETAEHIQLSDADLDTERFDKLLASLPTEVYGVSKNWTAWFLGEQTDTEAYIVRDDRLLLPETLAHSGLYYFGDTVQLTKDQAAELLRTDRPRPSDKAPWRCAPPSIMSLETHAAAVAEAEKAGISLKELLLWQDVERDKEARTSYKTEPWSTEHYPRERASTVPLGTKIRVRVRSPIQADEGKFEPGSILELKNEAEFWQLLDAGSIEHP